MKFENFNIYLKIENFINFIIKFLNKYGAMLINITLFEYFKILKFILFIY